MPSTVPSLDDRLAEVLLDRVLREVERLQRALSDEVAPSGPAARPWRCRAGCRPRPRSRARSAMLSPPEVYFTVDVGILLGEAVDDRLERRLLGAGPDADHGDRCRRRPPPRRSLGRRRSARLRHRRRRMLRRGAGGRAAVRGVVKRWSFMRLLSFRRRCRVPSRGRRSGARACRPRRSTVLALAGLRARAEAADHDRSAASRPARGVPSSVGARVLLQLAHLVGERRRRRRS